MEHNFWEVTSTAPIPTREDFDRRKGVVWASSNCVASRVQVMSELMRYVPIEARGGCLTNAPLIPGNHHNIVPHYAEYKVVIGFDKISDQDYVSEKFYNVFLANSVGVYFGSRSAHFYSPGENSFIFARDFKSIKELGDEINSILTDYDRWVKYFEWRRNPTKLGFLKSLNKRAAWTESTLCRICNCVCNSTCSDTSRAGTGIASQLPFYRESLVSR